MAAQHAKMSEEEQEEQEKEQESYSYRRGFVNLCKPIITYLIFCSFKFLQGPFWVLELL